MHQAEQVLPAVDALLGLLGPDPKGNEEYAFSDEAHGAVEIVIDAVFSGEVDPRPTLDEIVRLACALEIELRSPGAAVFLKGVLRADPRVVALFGRPSSEAQVLPWSGAPVEVRQAPMFGAAAPPGTLKVRAFVDTSRRRRP